MQKNIKNIIQKNNLFKKIFSIFILFFLIIGNSFSYNFQKNTFQKQRPQINIKIRTKIDLALKKFFLKIEKKYHNKEKQILILKKIKTTILKLKKKTTPKKEILLNYIFKKIELKLSKLENNKEIFSIIQKKHFGMNGGIFCMSNDNFDTSLLRAEKIDYIKNRFKLLKHLNVNIIRQLRFADIDRLWERHKNGEILKDSDFFLIDKIIEEAEANNMEVVLTLYGSIKEKTTIKEKFGDTISDYNKAEKYTELMIEKYNSKKNIYWEIGNEIIEHTKTSNEKIIFYNIAKKTSDKIRAINPNAKILFPGLNGTKKDKFKNTITRLKEMKSRFPDFLNFFDIYSFHYYGQDINNLAGAYDDFKDIIGENKEIWVTETGMSSTPNWKIKSKVMGIFGMFLTEEKQAKHLIKRMLIFFEKGAKKVFWHNMQYTLSNSGFYGCNLHGDNNGAKCGINDFQKSPKAAYYNYKLLSKKIGNFKNIYKHRIMSIGSKDFEIYDIELDILGTTKKIYIVWSTTGKKLFNLDFLGTSRDKFKITYAFKNLTDKSILSLDGSGDIITTNNPKINYIPGKFKSGGSLTKTKGISISSKIINLDSNIVFIEEY